MGMAVVVGACTAGTATELAEPVRPAGAVRPERLALLPVTTEPGSEDASPVVAEAALAFLEPWTTPRGVVGPDEAREVLGRSRLAATLARVLADYEATGIADPEDLATIADALGASHLLQLRVAYAESDVLRQEAFSEDVSDERRRDALIVARLWAAGRSGPLWEATARADSETGLFSTTLPGRGDMLRDVTTRLLERMPVEGRGGRRPATTRE